MQNTLYRLEVRGELDTRYAFLFNGMQMSQDAGCTILVGKVRDDAQLFAFLERIAELGLELVSVQQMADSPVGHGLRPRPAKRMS